MPIKFKSSRDVLIQSENLEKAQHFYETVLGLKMTHRDANMLGFETGSLCLYVEKEPSYGPVFEFKVPDFEAAKKSLLAAGCRIEKDEPDFPRCYFRDPFGLIFNVAKESKG